MHAHTTFDILVPYDYVVVYVDDFFAATNDPQHFFDALQSPPWNWKLKGIGEPCYHLGATFLQDADGTLYMGTQTSAKHLLSNYEKLFGDLPHPVFSCLPENDCPELDDTPLCEPDDVAKVQSLHGACQWMISLVHFNLAKPIMSLSCFCHCPCTGHLD